jgi:hypothetical protein
MTLLHTCSPPRLQHCGQSKFIMFLYGTLTDLIAAESSVTPSPLEKESTRNSEDLWQTYPRTEVFHVSKDLVGSWVWVERRNPLVLNVLHPERV